MISPAISFGGGAWGSAINAAQNILEEMFHGGKILVNISNTDSPVILHLLLAAEPFAAAVALVEAGDVTPLMDHQVVSLAEASVTPTTVKGFSNRLNLEQKCVNTEHS